MMNRFNPGFRWMLAGALVVLSLSVPAASVQELVERNMAGVKSPATSAREEAVRLNNEALRLAGEGKLSDALAWLRDARRQDGESKIIARNLAVLANNYATEKARARDYSGARSLLDDALYAARDAGLPEGEVTQMNRNYAAVLTAEAQSRMADHVYGRAERLLRDAIARDPGSVAAHTLLGRLYYEQNRNELSREYYDKAAKMAPRDAGLQQITQRLERESAVEEDFTSRKRGRFQVDYGNPDFAPQAREALRVLNEAARRVSTQFGLSPRGTIIVKIYDDAQYSEVTGAPHWSAGIYDGRIRIRAAQLGRPEEYLARVLSHEYAHALLSDRIRAEVPAWFQEGMAQYAEPEAAVAPQLRKRLRAAAAKDRLAPLSQMTAAFVESSGQQRAELMYAEAASFIAFLAETHGTARVRRLLSLLGAGAEWERAWSRAFGKSLDALEAEWKKSLAG